MGILRVLICLFFPPLAVIDKGCGVLLLVCVLTLFGWIPGVLAALIICVQQPPTQQQQSRESSLGAVAFVLFLVVGAAAYFALHRPADQSSPSIAPAAPKPTASPVATIATPTKPPAASTTTQFATVAEAQQEAVRRYPDIGVAGSKLNTEFVARYKRYQQERPDFLRDPSWPLRLAEELVPPSTPVPAAKPAARRPTQAEANAFVGLTEAQLVQRLGQPISSKTSSSPDGPFKMLEWDRTKGSETFFSIFADDGRVNYGYYRGVPTKTK